jgi:hypothetical protein
LHFLHQNETTAGWQDTQLNIYILLIYNKNLSKVKGF